ncbi:MAG TPA: response regulator [Acidobacteriaceae bacterium]|nr:response regulator [Acidobacteriaceae bacterium]
MASALHATVILCVDDEEIPRTLRQMVLVKQGYTVLCAVSAAEALDLLDQHHVDLVLTDQMMPGIVGTELAKRLRVSRPSLPIIIVSGVNEIPDDAAFADRFVSKVEGPEALFRSIIEVLARYSSDAAASIPSREKSIADKTA